MHTMPKIKTNRAAAKRFKTTKSGIIKRSKAYARRIRCGAKDILCLPMCTPRKEILRPRSPI